jgi:hypothetical protein
MNQFCDSHALKLVKPQIPGGIPSGYSQQAGVEVERAVGGHLSASVGYSRLRGRGIIMQRNVNVPTLTVAQANALGVPNLGRPNPNFGNINQYDALGDTWCNGLMLSVTTQSTPWGRARVSYQDGGRGPGSFVV